MEPHTSHPTTVIDVGNLVILHGNVIRPNHLTIVTVATMVATEAVDIAGATVVVVDTVEEVEDGAAMLHARMEIRTTQKLAIAVESMATMRVIVTWLIIMVVVVVATGLVGRGCLNAAIDVEQLDIWLVTVQILKMYATTVISQAMSHETALKKRHATGATKQDIHQGNAQKKAHDTMGVRKLATTVEKLVTCSQLARPLNATNASKKGILLESVLLRTKR